MTEHNNTQKPIIWSISGSDCSGGAGIAADIKTGHAIGVEVCYLMTANTAQNSEKLISVNPVSAALLTEQAQLLHIDKAPNVIKIGLIANREQITWLCLLIKQVREKNSHLQVVFDPVGSASVGGKFSDLTANDFADLLPLIDIITPNFPEAQMLASKNNTSATELALAIQKLGVNSVIIKGGHLPSKNELEKESHSLKTAQDYCLHRQANGENISYQLSSASINTDFSHGGGCSFASAVASYLALGYLLRDAFTITKAFINQGLAANKNKLGYYGAFEQVSQIENNSASTQFFPIVCDEIQKKHQYLTAFKNLGIKRDGSQALGLYPVVDSLTWLEKLLPLGLEIIQLRVKNLTGEELNSTIAKAVALSKNYNTRLFINDYWQLAIKHGAYGVHIGQEDLIDADLSQIQAAGLRLGISTHGCYEFLLAQQLKPSYLAIGAIFPTKTKDMTGQIQGLDNLKQILTIATDIPVVAIGGINHQRAAQVWQTGVDSIAVVTAITEAEDYQKAVVDFQLTCD